jgi:glycosyltransferase involved in cell wall biosynthesis
MKVSIGIPFYNPGVFFKDAISSVLKQSFVDFELILLNDGSRDESLDIANSFDDSRVKVISDGENRGLPYRLNQLIDLSQGEYIARMDADDLISAIRLEQQVALLDETPNVDIIATGICSIKNNNKVIGYRQPPEDINSTPSISETIFGNANIVHATILVRKSWYLRNRYNEKAKLMGDYQLWVDAAIKNDLNVAYIPTPLYFYREESSVTLKKSIKAYINVLKVVITNYFQYLTLASKLKIVTLTFAKIGFVSLISLLQLSDKILKLRNKSTEQNPELIKRLQVEVDYILTIENT